MSGNVAPSIHVLSPSHGGLAATLEAQLGTRVQVEDRMPQTDAVGHSDILVIDLDDTRLRLKPKVIRPLVPALKVWLVSASPIAREWLDLTLCPGVEVVRCARRDSTNQFRSVGARLLRGTAGPTGGDVAQMVVEREPGLGAVREFVRALCERPWEIRRPRDLAAACGLSPRAVRLQVAKVGFQRVEHFLTYVRHVGLEQLAARRRVSLSTGRQLMGITDPSNLRRQLRRARLGYSQAGSGAAAGAVAAVAAGTVA